MIARAFRMNRTWDPLCSRCHGFGLAEPASILWTLWTRSRDFERERSVNQSRCHRAFRGPQGLRRGARDGRIRDRLFILRAAGPVEPLAPGAELELRIHFPPADSPSLAGNRFHRQRTPAFRAGVRGWLGNRVGRDGHGLATWRRMGIMSLLAQIPVPQCRDVVEGAIEENISVAPYSSTARSLMGRRECQRAHEVEFLRV